MKKVLLSFLLFSISFTGFATNYYFKTTGTNPALNTHWGTAANQATPIGTGSPSVAVFGNGLHNFYLRNSTNNPSSVNLTTSWNTNGSLVIVGYSAAGTGFTFNINTGSVLTATVDVTNGNTLAFNAGNYSAVSMGTLGSASTVIYNRASADAVIDGNYGNITLSGTGAISFGPTVYIDGTLTVQCSNSVSGVNAPSWSNNATAILVYKPANGVNYLTGPEWPAIIGTNDELRGGVTIDAQGTTGTVTLNQAKSLLGGYGGYAIALRLTSVGKLITNNFKLTLSGDFIRAAGSVFTAGSSQIEICDGTQSPVSIAGFTTTGLVSFTKGDPGAIINMTGNLPEDGSIGTFPMTVAFTMTGNAGTDYTDNTEVNFFNGTSAFKTTGTLTVAKGRLFLHRTLISYDISTLNGGNPQINQCGNFIINSTNAVLSYCSGIGFADNCINIPYKSIFRVAGNFTKTGGKLVCNSAPSFNGDLEFIGNVNHNMSNDASGMLYQTTFHVMSGSTVTLTSDIVMNGGYGVPGALPLNSSWENFVVESGGTLNFSTFRILGGQGFEARSGSTIMTSHAEGFYDGANNSGNTLGCVRTEDPNSNVDQTAPNVFSSITNFKRRWFSNDASYIYTGSGNQSTGLFNTYPTNTSSGASTLAVHNLGFNKTVATNVVTAIQEFIVNGELQQTNGIFAYTVPAGTPQLTLNGTVTGTNGRIRGNVLNDLVLGNTGTGGTGNLGTLYFDQTTPGVAVGTGGVNDLTAITQGTTNVLRRLNVTRTNGTTATLGNQLQVSNMVIPTSGTIASGGNLVILSNSSYTGNILALGAGASITGDVVVQSYFAGSADLTNRGFRMISSPIVEVAYSNTSSKNFFRQLYNRFIVTCAAWPSDGCDFKPVRNPNAQTIQSYLEPGTSSVNPTTSFGDLNPQSAAERGRGYYFFFRGNRSSLNALTAGKINSPYSIPEDWIATYIGTINSGTFTAPVTRTDNSETTLDGLNMLGNPYPATLDMQTFLTNNSGVIDNFLSIMRPNRTGFVTSSGDIINNFGNNLILGATPVAGNSSIRLVQQGQGFFVRKTSVGSSTVSFNELQKASAATIAGGTIRRLLSTKEDVAKPVQRKLIRVTLNSNETQEQTTIVLEPGNDANYSGYDAPYQANSPIVINTLTADGKNACINFMPEVSQVKQIKLDINSATNPNLKLTFDELIGAEEHDVLLKDNFKNTLTKIKSIKDTINFAVDKAIPATFGSERFALQFYGKNVLPLQVDGFKIVAQSNDVLLTWNTLSEQNAKSIIVQRSTDGVNFVDIKTVDVKGNSTETLNYSYLDKNAEVGTVYYRLQKNDIDGTFKFSDVKSVTFGLDAEDVVRVFPNPVASQLNVWWKTTESVNMAIYDVAGKMVKTYKNVKTENFKANVSDLANGFYILKLTNNKTNKLIADTKFIKQ